MSVIGQLVEPEELEPKTTRIGPVPEPEKPPITSSSKNVEKPSTEEKPPTPRPPLSIWNPKSARWQFTMLLLLVNFADTTTRNSMSMAIVCMVNTTALGAQKEWKNDTTGPSDANATEALIRATTTDGKGVCADVEEDTKYEGPLLWSSDDRGLVVSSVYWGGLITALPAGYFADRHSPKAIIAGCLLINTICCFLTPIATVHGGIPAVVALRFLMGLAGLAIILPTASSMASKWIPPGDRSTCVALYTTGVQLGMIVTGPLNAFLCRQPSLLGTWESIFYVSGFAVVPILIVWLVFAADKPRKYKWIRKHELQYIKESLAEQHLRKVKWKHLPWKGMLLSCPLLVALLSSFSLSVTATTLQKYIPSYFKESLKMNLKKNGAYSALPFVAQCAGKVLAAPIADRMRSKKVLSPTWTCKVFNSIGTFVSSAFLIATAYMTCSEVGAAVALAFVSSFFYSFQLAGFVTSLISMAPAFTGIVNSLSRFVGQAASVMAPLVVGAMTEQGSNEQWRAVFWLMSGLSIFAGTLFLAFGSGEIQSWAKRKDGEEEGSVSSVDSASYLL